MQIKRFQRKIEDFTCEHCGAAVRGTGYTNHCPHCLWSKHVDINPGDRLSTCQGLMEPVGVEVKGSGTTLLFRCVKCGATKRCKTTEGDDADVIILLSAAGFEGA